MSCRCRCGELAVKAFQDSMLEALEAFDPCMVDIIEPESVNTGNDGAQRLRVPIGQNSQNRQDDAA